MVKVTSKKVSANKPDPEKQGRVQALFSYLKENSFKVKSYLDREATLLHVLLLAVVIIIF